MCCKDVSVNAFAKDILQQEQNRIYKRMEGKVANRRLARDEACSVSRATWGKDHATVKRCFTLKPRKKKKKDTFGDLGTQKIPEKSPFPGSFNLADLQTYKALLCKHEAKKSTRTCNNIWANISWQFPHLFVLGLLVGAGWQFNSSYTEIRDTASISRY